MLERQVLKLSNAEHCILIALNHHKVLVLIQEAGETSKLSSGLHGVGGNLLCPSPGAAWQGSPVPSRA